MSEPLFEVMQSEYVLNYKNSAFEGEKMLLQNFAYNSFEKNMKEKLEEKNQEELKFHLEAVALLLEGVVLEEIDKKIWKLVEHWDYLDEAKRMGVPEETRLRREPFKSIRKERETLRDEIVCHFTLIVLFEEINELIVE